MIEPQSFARKTFVVQAVEVTAENMSEVAKWCNGEIRLLPRKGDVKFIHVRVHHALNERQTQAFVGDWVLYAGTGYKVYTPKAFENCFDPCLKETDHAVYVKKDDVAGVTGGTVPVEVLRDAELTMDVIFGNPAPKP